MGASDAGPIPSQRSLVEIHSLSRTYVTRKSSVLSPARVTQALDHVNLEIFSGEILGLLGPNGAGKTSLVKILATLLLPSEGEVRVFGLDVTKDVRSIRARIGLVLGGERGLYGRLSAIENLRFFGALQGITGADATRRIGEVLEIVGLTEAADRRVEEYSRGMKQRLHIARGIFHRPELLLLDEPTVGLDPKSAREMRELVRKLNLRGVTTLITTHYMFEAEELCSRVAILSRGRLVALDNVDGLRRIVGGERMVEIECASLDSTQLGLLRELAGTGKIITEDIGQRTRLSFPAKGSLSVATVRDAVGTGSTTSVVERRTTLEDVYLQLVAE